MINHVIYVFVDNGCLRRKIWKNTISKMKILGCFLPLLNERWPLNKTFINFIYSDFQHRDTEIIPEKVSDVLENPKGFWKS